MEQRQNRRSLLEGIIRMLQKCDFRLLKILYDLLRYVLGEE